MVSYAYLWRLLVTVLGAEVILPAETPSFPARQDNSVNLMSSARLDDLWCIDSDSLIKKS